MLSDGAKFFMDRCYDSVDYCRQEFDISYVEIVGALEIIKSDILDEMREAVEASEEDSETNEERDEYEN